MPEPTALMSIRYVVENALSEGRLGHLARAIPFGEKAYWQWFCSGRGGDNFQFGSFTSYADARAAIPPRANSGWNNANSARHYIDTATQPSSYAVVFWLSKVLHTGMRLLDLGGSTGQMFHTIRRLDAMPDAATWHVVDVPAAVTLGRERAAADGLTELFFESELSNVPPCEVLVASGAIQFIGDPVPGLLEQLQQLPRWVIINKIVLTQLETFWTLHNIRTGICTYQIFNEAEFIGYFASLGYTLRDRWNATEMSMLIPFHPETFVPHGTGLCFERATETAP